MNAALLLQKKSTGHRHLRQYGCECISQVHCFHLVAWQAGPALASVFSKPQIHICRSPWDFHALSLHGRETKKYYSTPKHISSHTCTHMHTHSTLGNTKDTEHGSSEESISHCPVSPSWIPLLLLMDDGPSFQHQFEAISFVSHASSLSYFIWCIGIDRLCPQRCGQTWDHKRTVLTSVVPLKRKETLNSFFRQ